MGYYMKYQAKWCERNFENLMGHQKFNTLSTVFYMAGYL